MCKNIFNGIFLYNRKGDSYFLQNFKSLNILSKRLEINIKCHDRLTWGQNVLIKPTILPDFKVYDHRLSPLPNSIFFFLLLLLLLLLLFYIIFYLLTILWLNIGRKKSLPYHWKN